MIRLYRIHTFDVNGDEWYSIANAQSPGRSYYSLLYFSILTAALKGLHFSFENLRILSALFGALTAPLIFKITERFDGKKSAFLATILFTVAAFNIAESQEMRMYSLFCFLSAASILIFLFVLEKKSIGLIVLWGCVSLFNLATHFNAVFLLVGQVGIVLTFFLLPRIKTVRGRVLFVSFCLCMFLLVIIFREAIFFSILKLAEPTVTLKSGIRGYNLGTFIKIPFVIYQFIFGPNTSPYEVWVIPLSSLFLGSFAYGAWRHRIKSFGLFALFILVIPVGLLFLVVEPFSNPGFTLVMPKHAIFAFPIFISGVAIGLNTILEKKKTRIFILFCLVFCLGINLYRYYFPTYTYYSGRALGYRKMPLYFQNWSKPKRTLCVVDGRTWEPFHYYMRSKINNCDVVMTPEGFIATAPETADAIILAVSDWTAYHGKGTLNANDRKHTYVKMENFLNGHYEIKDGFVDYPLFFYIFRKEKDNGGEEEIALPIDFYDIRYRDLRLPIFPEPHYKIWGSFSLNAERPEWAINGVDLKAGQSLTLYANLESSESIKSGEKVAVINITDQNRNTEKFDLVKGINIGDGFEIDPDKDRILQGLIRVSWTKFPLVSSAIIHPGSYRQFEASFFKILIPFSKIQGISNITLKYLENSGALRIWGMNSNQNKEVSRAYFES